MHKNHENHHGIISRSRLSHLLEMAVQFPFVLVQAGSGFGKTQAVASYLIHSKHQKVWMSITCLDNIPSRFWENFTVAVGRNKPDLANKMDKWGFPDNLQTFDLFLREFTGVLYQESQFVIFAFDNIHLITEPLVKTFISGLIEARMENNSIILITRHWPIQGWNISEVPQVIADIQLQFTPKETLELLQTIDADWRAEDAEEIQRYVSGWPMALSVSAQYLYHHNLFHPRKLDFSSTKPLLFQLFDEKIFSQYTENEQSLLIKLSVLESFPRGLVTAVSGERYREVRQLVRDNPFIVYDGIRGRLYFQPLYQEFLKEKLLKMSDDEVREAYEKAAAWCREKGHFYDAINYYHCYGAFTEIWETLQLLEVKKHSKAEAEFLINEIKSLPEQLHRENPVSRIVLATLLANNLRFFEAMQMIKEVRQDLENREESEENQALLGECYAAHGLIAMETGTPEFLFHFRKAAKLLPGGSRYLGKGIPVVLKPGLKLQKTGPGELQKSVDIYCETAPLLQSLLNGVGQGLGSLCQSEALFLTGDVKNALAPAYQALYAASNMEQYDIMGSAFFVILRCYAAIGDYKSMKDIMTRVHRYENDEVAGGYNIWDILKGWYYTEMEDTQKVPAWLRSGFHDSHPPFSIEFPLIIRARYLFFQRKYAEVLAITEQLAYLAKKKQSVLVMLYSELGRSAVNYALGNIDSAIDALVLAYGLTCENDICMPFIEFGSRMRSQLERLRNMERNDVPAEWLDRIYAKTNTYAKCHAYLVACYQRDQGIFRDDFGLSRRETELIIHLSQGLTRGEIGDCMNLSLNTVKSMLKQVFSKLGAINTADAIRIAVINKLV